MKKSIRFILFICFSTFIFGCGNKEKENGLRVAVNETPHPDPAPDPIPVPPPGPPILVTPKPRPAVAKPPVPLVLFPLPLPVPDPAPNVSLLHQTDPQIVSSLLPESPRNAGADPTLPPQDPIAGMEPRPAPKVTFRRRASIPSTGFGFIEMTVERDPLQQPHESPRNAGADPTLPPQDPIAEMEPRPAPKVTFRRRASIPSTGFGFIEMTVERDPLQQPHESPRNAGPDPTLPPQDPIAEMEPRPAPKVTFASILPTSSVERELPEQPNESQKNAGADPEQPPQDSVAETDSETDSAEVEQTDSNGLTPLQLAVWEENNSETQRLIEAKADVNVKDNDGRTVLHYAVSKMNTALVEILIQAQVDVNVQDNNGRTVLHYAVSNKDIDLVKRLIKARMDVNLQDKYGDTALHDAVGCDDLKIVKVLVENGAKLEIKGSSGRTARVWAESLRENGKTNGVIAYLEAAELSKIPKPKPKPVRRFRFSM